MSSLTRALAAQVPTSPAVAAAPAEGDPLTRPRAAAGDGGQENSHTFLEESSLTFPGLTIASGAILNFFAPNDGPWRLIIAAIVAALMGALILYVGLTDENATRRTRREMNINIAVGVIDTFRFFICIVGVASIESPTGG